MNLIDVVRCLLNESVYCICNKMGRWTFGRNNIYEWRKFEHVIEQWCTSLVQYGVSLPPEKMITIIRGSKCSGRVRKINKNTMTTKLISHLRQALTLNFNWVWGSVFVTFLGMVLRLGGDPGEIYWREHSWLLCRGRRDKKRTPSPMSWHREWTSNSLLVTWHECRSTSLIALTPIMLHVRRITARRCHHLLIFFT